MCFLFGKVLDEKRFQKENKGNTGFDMLLIRKKYIKQVRLDTAALVHELDFS